MSEKFAKAVTEATRQYERYQPLIQYFEDAAVSLPLPGEIDEDQVKKSMTYEFFKLRDA